MNLPPKGQGVSGCYSVNLNGLAAAVITVVGVINFALLDRHFAIKRMGVPCPVLTSSLRVTRPVLA